MNTIDKIYQIMKEKNLTEYKVSKDCGFSQAYFHYWKKREREPSRKIIILLANYFGVSTDYLLGQDEEKPKLMTIKEQMIIDTLKKIDYESMTEKQVNELLEFIEVSAEHIKNKRK